MVFVFYPKNCALVCRRAFNRAFVPALSDFIFNCRFTYCFFPLPLKKILPEVFFYENSRLEQPKISCALFAYVFQNRQRRRRRRITYKKNRGSRKLPRFFLHYSFTPLRCSFLFSLPLPKEAQPHSRGQCSLLLSGFRKVPIL